MAKMREPLSVIDVTSAGEVVYPAGGALGPRTQRDTQLVLVHSGSARIAVDGVARTPLRAGDVALLRPGHRERFAFAPDTPTRHSWIQARLQGLPDELPPQAPASPFLAGLIREAARAPAGPLRDALAAAAFWRYAADAAAPPASVAERARAYLDAHVSDPDVDLAAVARAVGVSPPHLVRRVRAELRTTPMAYLWQRRVAEGIDLLAGTGLPVGDVAARCGFKSVYHFSRRVRAQAGVSPTGLRRARWDA
jgi:AraC-like DNA-binding protein